MTPSTNSEKKQLRFLDLWLFCSPARGPLSQQNTLGMVDIEATNFFPFCNLHRFQNAQTAKCWYIQFVGKDKKKKGNDFVSVWIDPAFTDIFLLCEAQGFMPI